MKEDILILFQNYLSYISAFWDQAVPTVLSDLYIPLYDIYMLVLITQKLREMPDLTNNF